VLVFQTLPQLAAGGRGVGFQAFLEKLVEALGSWDVGRGIRFAAGAGLEPRPQVIAGRGGVPVQFIPE
jgi:hypothetical protein